MTTGIQVASLFGVLGLDNQLSGGLETAKNDLSTFGDTLGKKLKDAGQTVTNLGVSLTLLGAPFLAFAATSVAAAAESELSMAQLDAVLKSTGGSAGVTKDQVLALSTELQNTTRYSDEAETNMQSLLLTFTNIGGDIFPQAAIAINDVSTAMGQDLSQSAIQVGKALNDPVNGMTALQRIGVTFSDSQKAAIQAMVDTGDTAGAQKIILAELTKEFGGSAVAAGQTFPGQLDILKNKFNDVQEKIGGVIATALTPLMDTVTNLITGFSQLPAPVQDFIIKGIMLGAAMAIVGPILVAVGTALSAIGTVVGILLSPIGILILLIAGLVFALNSLYPGGLAKLLLDASTAATQLALLGMAILGGAVQWVKDQVAALINKILELIGKLSDLKTAISDGLGAYSGVGGNINTAVGAVTSGQYSVGDVINAGITAVGQQLGLGGHASGTPFVSREGLYYLHRGEKVLTANENQGGGGMNFSGDITIIASNPQDFAQQIQRRFRGRGNGRQP